eukprot:gnl/TRDRNA2_/TRDRNA2_166931_c1_seq1.p1 gnl/TRDRNA2_/TRDRNA2_166931_c1~~gnl/TRDRNA2_/TRDRNA2_166931_c1_seq1.p1  ORF type:complete len:701 (+),score=68.77 gnl/TRDRNA2_/TRDRNA2_166931_c1_seq1:112-2214(+)
MSHNTSRQTNVAKVPGALIVVKLFKYYLLQEQIGVLKENGGSFRVSILEVLSEIDKMGQWVYNNYDRSLATEVHNHQGGHVFIPVPFMEDYAKDLIVVITVFHTEKEGYYDPLGPLDSDSSDRCLLDYPISVRLFDGTPDGMLDELDLKPMALLKSQEISMTISGQKTAVQDQVDPECVWLESWHVTQSQGEDPKWTTSWSPKGVRLGKKEFHGESEWDPDGKYFTCSTPVFGPRRRIFGLMPNFTLNAAAEGFISSQIVSRIADEYAPDHKPCLGEFVFVGITFGHTKYLLANREVELQIKEECLAMLVRVLKIKQNHIDCYEIDDRPEPNPLDPNAGAMVIKFKLMIPDRLTLLVTDILNKPSTTSRMQNSIRNVWGLESHKWDLELDRVVVRRPKDDTQCRTEGNDGAGPNYLCVFPFVFEKTTFWTCSPEGWHRPWCPTSRPIDLVRNWGNCGRHCEVAAKKVSILEQAGPESPGDVCFPGNAKVISRAGIKEMSQVNIGDELLGFNQGTGKDEFTKVRAWLHRSAHKEATFTKLHTREGAVIVSPGHNMAVGRHDTFAFAQDISSGSALVTSNGTVPVTRSSSENGIGFYAPWTTTANFYVGSGEGQGFFLAHSLANVPSRLGKVATALFDVLEIVWPSIHDLHEGEDTDYLHPVARIFWSAVEALRSSSGDRQMYSLHPVGALIASVVGVRLAP